MVETVSVQCAPIKESSLSKRPFKELAIDIVCEIHLASTRGHRFILSIIYTFSRWVEAFPLYT